MSSDILSAAFYRAEAAYLTPPEPECVCDCDMCENDLHCCEGDCEVEGDDDLEPDWEREQEIRDELREEGYDRD